VTTKTHTTARKTTHRRSTALVTATAAAVLGLTLTACSGGSDGKSSDEGASQTSPSVSATSSTEASGGSTEAAKAGGGSAQTPASGAGQNQKSMPAQGTQKTPECKVTSLSYTLKRRNAEQQGDHILITAVNKSGSACTVQKFPIVTPGDANGDVPLDKKQDQQPPQPLLVPAGGTIYSALPIYQEDINAENVSFSRIRLSLYMNNPDTAPPSSP